MKLKAADPSFTLSPCRQVHPVTVPVIFIVNMRVKPARQSLHQLGDRDTVDVFSFRRFFVGH